LIKGKNKFGLEMAVVNRKTGPVYVNGFKHEKLNEEKNMCLHSYFGPVTIRTDPTY
jgi:hypothetical protein